MTFNCIDWGRKKTMVLLPGWATDYRIFSSLDLDFNYILPVDFCPYGFEQSFEKLVSSENIKKVSLFGWSMGGFTAARFAAKHQSLIDELILVGVRKKYISGELNLIKQHLNNSKKGFLYKFYNQCFSTKEDMSWFKKNLLKDYCRGLELDYLLKTLDYLAESELTVELLKDMKKLKIIHGVLDEVAPIDEVLSLKDNLPKALFTAVKGAGHLPFLKEDFTRYI